MRGRLATGIIAAIHAAIGGAAASPWNRDAGGLFVSTTANYYAARDPLNSYTRIDSDTYAEFGLSRKWMAGGRVSYGTSIARSAGAETVDTGLNEAELYIQRQILRGEHSATSLKLSGLRSGTLSVDAQTGASTPNFEFELRALHGRDILLSPVKIFATGEIGYRQRLGGDAEQIRADALIGIEPSQDWLFLIEAQTVTSLRNEAPAFADFDLYKGQVSIVWRKSRRWSLAVGGRKEIAGRNISTGAAGFIGLWSEF